MNAIRMLVIDTSESTADLLTTDLLQVGIKAVTGSTDSRAGIEEGLQWFEPDLVLAEVIQ